jgi:hypothetical protein
MGTFAETANINYGLLFADQGKQTSVFRLQKTNENLPFPFCLQQTNGTCSFPPVSFSVNKYILIKHVCR